MKKQGIAILLILTLMLSVLPGASLAAAKQMNDGVPVWNEETVKDYATKYIHGLNYETLWGYYDLQIRRYMPMETYTTMLSDIEFLTGKFIEFGTYTSFEEPEQKTKTHVLHLCMEKQDLDMYFTHKNKDDDWEVMAVEFALAQEQDVSDHSDMLVTDAQAEPEAASYTEMEVTVGLAPYELGGTLTLPAGASAEAKVPAVVLVHGSGPSDRNETIGQTAMFADIAAYFAGSGIASIRYDKRTFVYGAAMTQDEINALTVEEETIQDAISAGRLLAQNECVDSAKIVLVGHSMGAMLAPRIASEAEGLFGGIVMIAGTPKSLLQVILDQNDALVESMTGDEQTAARQQVDALKAQAEALSAMTADEAKQATVAGVNGYYFWEMQQTDGCQLIKSLKLPTYIVQGSSDWQVQDGVTAYEEALGDDLPYVNYKIYRGLNHLLMKYTGPSADQGTTAEYNTAANLDSQAAYDLAQWVLTMGQSAQEEK